MSDDPALRAAHGAMQAWSAGKTAETEQLARQWVALRPNDPNALQILAAALLQLGGAEEAATHLRAADAVAPDHPAILNMLGRALRRLRDVAAARQAFTRAAALGLAEAWRNLGDLEVEAGDFAAAFVALENAVNAAPGSAAANAAFAHALLRRNEPGRARTHAARALAAAPQHQGARLALAQIAMRERNYDAVREIVAPLMDSPAATPTNRALALGLAGEALDRQGRPAEAFAAFAAANRLLLEAHGHFREALFSPYHPDAIARMTRLVAREDACAWRGAEASPSPVFLVGFPRSGTTLLDQVLASHPQIVSIEEKELFSPVVRDLLQDEAALARLGTLSDADIEARRRAYWGALRGAAGEEAQARTVVDKLPLNILFLPLIARIFPGARIVVALRDPRDVILSCFQQRFGMNTAMAQFLDLDSSARYYDLVMTLFEACREKLPLRFHAVRYEDMVADLPGAARGLAAFLDLPFDPGMLDFTATARRRDINTPSAHQVVQPLYARSVGRWRPYAEHLAPVLPALERWALRLGYAA
jgi:tetratricopeptide (TPR) repeat protein